MTACCRLLKPTSPRNASAKAIVDMAVAEKSMRSSHTGWCSPKGLGLVVGALYSGT